MSYKNILLLGDPKLYEVCQDIAEDEKEFVGTWINALKAAHGSFRERFGFGRGIAAPQLGILKNLIFFSIDGLETVFINPKITFKSAETFELWDDCMSFPNLMVKVDRHQKIEISYLDQHFEVQHAVFTGALSELFQHEYDHLNGVLCTMRAKDEQSLLYREL